MTATTGAQAAGRIMLSAEALCCERDDRMLFRDLNLAVREGQVVQITGANGSGKTTLLRILGGLYDGYAGALYWYERPMAETAAEYHAALAYIGHRAGVSKVLTPLEKSPLDLRPAPGVTDRELYEALAVVGLRGYEESQCFTLSAGQQQRVALARLLLSPAKLWLLDEPFSSLDAAGTGQLESLLGQHAGNGGAVMVTTHHPLAVADLQMLRLG